MVVVLAGDVADTSILVEMAPVMLLVNVEIIRAQRQSPETISCIEVRAVSKRDP